MKLTTILLPILLLLFCGVQAQDVPLGMQYQAVARDLQGNILPNQKITLKISLLGDQKSPVTYYSEIHQPTTNQLGLFTLVIGNGKTDNGQFASVPWSTENIWMQVAIKDKGRTDFATISNSKLLAVPYAFHALTASQLTDKSLMKNEGITRSIAGVPSQNWSLFGNLTSNPDDPDLKKRDKLGTTDYVDLVLVTNDLERMRIKADGNISMKRSLNIGADLNVDSNVNLNKISGSTINNGPFTVERQSPTLLTGTLTVNQATDLKSTLNVDGITDLNSNLNVNNASPTVLTGSLRVDGVTNLNSNLNVNNASPTILTGTLQVNKDAVFKEHVLLDNSSYNSTSSSTGALVINGGLGLGKNLNVGGTSKLNGQVIISATLPPDESNINNYPLIVQGSRNGVSIKIQGATPNRNENFITFWDGNGNARGRIEGFTSIAEPNRSAFIDLVNNANGQDSNSTASQDPNQPLPAAPTALQNINNNYAFGALNATLTLVQNIVKFVINLVACIAGVGLFGDCDDVAWSGIDMAISAVQFAAYIAYNQGNPGVAYESGGADYAEWLPKFDKKETMTFGDVVGVKAGVVSKTFSGAEKFMIVSRNPGVIGGMPNPDQALEYEKIAFMGQVPVKVFGKVHKEDYILPSGNGDGMAMAVPPNQMHAGDFKRVIGIAWSESDSLKDFNYINTAVGINANDMAKIVEDMQLVLNNIQLSLKKLDPNYKPSLYSTSRKYKNVSDNYSKSPSFRETISNDINMGKYENSKEALKEIDKYVSKQGLDLSQFKYLSQLMKNPTLPEAQKALDHYTKVITKLEGMLITANSVKVATRKN